MTSAGQARHTGTERIGGSRQSVAFARTWHFVPGNRAERFDKSRVSSTDEVICDLEDPGDPDHKDRARSDVAWLLGHGGSAWPLFCEPL
jgi:HpcH/HpaI aldolase/citrate lyase family